MKSLRASMGFVVVLAALGVVRGDEPAKDKFAMSKMEKNLLDLVNKEREKEKLPALKANPTLFKVARGHSANMAKQRKLAHELDGKNAFDRIKDSGYKFLKAGENVAAFKPNLALVMKMWMNSPFHRGNILSKDYQEIGLGMVPDKKGIYFYTQVFAKPLK